jgi:hypothetical protein
MQNRKRKQLFLKPEVKEEKAEEEEEEEEENRAGFCFQSAKTCDETAIGGAAHTHPATLGRRSDNKQPVGG